MKKLFIFAITSLIYVNTFATCNPHRLLRMASLMAKRASIMKEVAAYKWYYAPKHQASAYSAKQEIKVLNGVSRLAKKMDIRPLSLMVFSQIQMDLSKQIESHWIDYWNNSKTPTRKKPSKNTVKSLNTLRRNITHIDKQLFPMIQSNIVQIQKCSVNQMQPTFAHAYSKVIGIPSKPSYLDILIQSLKQVKQ